MEFEFKLTLDGLLVVISTLFSPLLALWISGKFEERRFKKERQLQIFRMLMKHRLNPLYAEFVDALNLVEVEFSDEEKVINARKKLQEVFNRDIVTPEGDQRQKEDINSNLIKLISEISSVLKIKIDQIDIQCGSYIPKGWNYYQDRREGLDNAMYDVLTGKKSININLDDGNCKKEDVSVK